MTEGAPSIEQIIEEIVSDNCTIAKFFELDAELNILWHEGYLSEEIARFLEEVRETILANVTKGIPDQGDIGIVNVHDYIFDIEFLREAHQKYLAYLRYAVNAYDPGMPKAKNRKKMRIV